MIFWATIGKDKGKVVTLISSQRAQCIYGKSPVSEETKTKTLHGNLSAIFEKVLIKPRSIGFIKK